jgi:NADPH:quinone reductase
MAETMKALRITRHGGPDVMEIAEVPVPEPKPGEVRIRVVAAGLNYSDIMIREGSYIDATQLPCYLGREACGVIDKVGPGVKGLEVGQRVVATAPGGAFAEYLCANAAGLLPCPDGISPDVGAAIMIQGLTAVHCLDDLGQLKKDETVLIHAAAGGVGSLAVQIAVAMGGKVFGTASSEKKCDQIRALGATPINYSEGDWVKKLLDLSRGSGVKLILESVGGDTCLRSFKEALKPFGRMVVYGVASGEVVSLTNREILESNKILMGYYLGSYFPDHMSKIMSASMKLVQYIAQGKVKPVIGQTFPLDRAREAFDCMHQRRSIGKVIIKP